MLFNFINLNGICSISFPIHLHMRLHLFFLMICKEFFNLIFCFAYNFLTIQQILFIKIKFFRKWGEGQNNSIDKNSLEMKMASILSLLAILFFFLKEMKEEIVKIKRSLQADLKYFSYTQKDYKNKKME